MKPSTLALALVLSSPAFASSSSSPAGSPPEVGGHWTSDTFTLEVIPAEDVVDTGALMTAAQAAAETWNETGLGPQIVVVAAASGVSGGFRLDGHNTLSLVTSAWPADHRFAGLTARGVRQGRTGDEIVETDSLINAADWSFVDGDERGKLDLQSVLTHELGHTLGLLDDDAHEEATMYYASHDHDTSKRTLSPLDVSALEKSYAGITLEDTGAAAVGCSSAGLGGAPAALALVLVALRRRRR